MSVFTALISSDNGFVPTQGWRAPTTRLSTLEPYLFCLRRGGKHMIVQGQMTWLDAMNIVEEYRGMASPGNPSPAV